MLYVFFNNLLKLRIVKKTVNNNYKTIVVSLKKTLSMFNKKKYLKAKKP